MGEYLIDKIEEVVTSGRGYQTEFIGKGQLGAQYHLVNRDYQVADEQTRPILKERGLALLNLIQRTRNSGLDNFLWVRKPEQVADLIDIELENKQREAAVLTAVQRSKSQILSRVAAVGLAASMTIGGLVAGGMGLKGMTDLVSEKSQAYSQMQAAKSELLPLIEVWQTTDGNDNSGLAQVIKAKGQQFVAYDKRFAELDGDYKSSYYGIIIPEGYVRLVGSFTLLAAAGGILLSAAETSRKKLTVSLTQ